MATLKKQRETKIIIITLLAIILICSLILILKIKIKENEDTKKQIEISDIINKVDTTQIEVILDGKTDRMIQVEKLKQENEDIIGWLEIEGTNISYPVLQGDDNDYYLTHSYKKEEIIGGSIFLDKDYDFSIPSSNLLIYGHRHKAGLMFEDLVKYQDENFYKEHQMIRFTTPTEDSKYEIIAAFNSRVYYKDETDVFRYYYFVNASNQTEYDEFVENCKKASIYDTGKTATYGEQLLTLSTCEYSQENGRFAVVAKKLE